MAVDFSLYARRAGLTLLNGDATLAAATGGRIYPPQRPPNPVWPFVAWGVADVAPFDASCMTGAEVSLAVHVFAATDDDGAGEERAAAYAARVATVLVDAGEVDLSDYGCPVPAVAQFTWERTQVIQDGIEADAFHALVFVRAAIAA